MVFVFSCVFSGPMGDLTMYRATVAGPGGFYSGFCVFAPVLFYGAIVTLVYLIWFLFLACADLHFGVWLWVARLHLRPLRLCLVVLLRVWRMEEVGIGRGGSRFPISSIFGIVVFFHSSLVFGHGKIMCV